MTEDTFSARAARLDAESANQTEADDLKPPAAEPAMFHGIVGDIVHAAGPTTEADPVGVLVSLLSGIGTYINDGPHVQIGNSRHPLLIWPLLFGRTGSGRKGEAGETAGIFLRQAAHLYPNIEITGLSSGEGLIERIRDPNPDDDKDNGGTEDKRLAITEPEFASVMARARREGSTLAAVLREAWAGKPLSVLNRKAMKASSSHVGIVGHITPKEFRLRLADAEMAGGTFNRFLPVYVERSQKLPLPTGASLDLVKDLSQQLAESMKKAKKIGAIGLDDGAKKLWIAEIYDEMSAADDVDATWTEFARRSAPYCRRIAALYAALDGRDHVNENDLRAAAALGRYSIETAKFVLNPGHRDPREDRITRALDAAGEKGMSRTEIRALFSRHVTAKDLDDLLTKLIERGRYEECSEPTGGRPVKRYRAKSAKSAKSQ